MKTDTPKTMQLGELIVAAFDKAAQQSSDPREISRLATTAVQRMLRRARKTSSPPQRQQHPAKPVPSSPGDTS